MRASIPCLILILLINFWPWQSAAAQEPTPTPDIGRLTAAPLPDNPTQADLGAQVYYQVCMACHGDRGQGLTDEWRAVWEEDSNCWQSDCHGPDHPPWGFSIPETCCLPVLEGTQLTRFSNAQELHQYLIETMPWWNPGYLTAEQYWQLTAFIVREQGGLPDNVEIGPINAAIFNLHPNILPPDDIQSHLILVASILALAGGLFLLQNRVRG